MQLLRRRRQLRLLPLRLLRLLQRLPYGVR